MTNTLNMLVLRPSGTIAVWTHDDVDNGWAYTAAEARAVASRFPVGVARLDFDHDVTVAMNTGHRARAEQP